MSGVVLVVAALAERGRYGFSGEAADATFDARVGELERTEEVFEDPVTGVRTRVWYDPTTGRRIYEPDR